MTTSSQEEVSMVKGPARKYPVRGKPVPKGYKKVYEWPDSDYATERRAVLVKKKAPVNKKASVRRKKA